MSVVSVNYNSASYKTYPSKTFIQGNTNFLPANAADTILVPRFDISRSGIYAVNVNIEYKILAGTNINSFDIRLEREIGIGSLVTLARRNIEINRTFSTASPSYFVNIPFFVIGQTITNIQLRMTVVLTVSNTFQIVNSSMEIIKLA